MEGSDTLKRVYCLYRVSHRVQVEENDIPMQRISCRTYAKEHGWEIFKELSEKGMSGYKLSMKERDAITELREDAMAGKFDILLVYMFDRIGRRDDETPFVVEWLTRNGIAVWSVCEGEQRFDNHVDKLTNYIRYWQAAGESEKISERTRIRIRQLTEEGLFTGGQCPYGYELIKRLLALRPLWGQSKWQYKPEGVSAQGRLTVSARPPHLSLQCKFGRRAC